MVILDIQKNKVEIAKIVQKFNTINVGPVCSFVLPEEARQSGKYIPKKIAELAKSCLARRKLDKEEIILLLPDRLIISREFTHNKNTKENLNALSILEAEAILHKPTQEYVISTYEYGKRLTIDGVYRSGLYVVKKTDLNEYVEAFSEYKLKLVKVLPPIYAYSLMMTNILKQENNKKFFDNVVVGIDLGSSRTLLSVVCQQTVLYERGLGSVFDEVISFISNQLNMDFDTSYEFFLQNGISSQSEGYVNNTSLFEEVNNLLTNSLQEIFRTLRLILSAERLELDFVCISGISTTVPGLNNLISSLAGAESFFSKDLTNSKILKYNPRLTEINKYMNFFGAVYLPKKGSADFIGVKVKRKSATSSKKPIIAVAIIAVLIMSVTPVYYLFLQQRANEDKATLQKYASTYNMLNTINASQSRIASQTRDINKLFTNKKNTYKVLEKLFENLGLRSNIVDLEYNVGTNVVGITFRVTQLDTYVLIRNSFDKSAYFRIAVPFVAQKQGNYYIVNGEITVLEGAYE